MNKTFTIVFLSFFSFTVKAQTISPPPYEAFGKVSKEDLELKQCDFEKDANAEILFDIGTANSQEFGFTRHLRIKVFNDFGKAAGSVRLDFLNSKVLTGIKDLEAETINLENGQLVTTQLDKKQIYLEKTNNLQGAVVFAMPNVKAGSIIDIQYNATFTGIWYFQNNIPTRFSEINTDFPSVVGREFKFVPHVKQAYVVDKGRATDFTQDKALADIHSLPNEAFMGSRNSNRQRVEYLGIISSFNTWAQIGELVQKYIDANQNIDVSFSGEKAILDEAKKLKSNNEKIAFIYDQVKANLKWNNVINFFPQNSPQKVWDTKTGNSAEINWIVYHLLKKAGINALPLIIGDKNASKMNPFLPDLYAMANMVVYIPIDTAINYVLDATNKYNLYNAIPVDELNTYGLCLDKKNEFDEKKYQMVFLADDAPAIQAAFVNAEIKADGKISGTADLTSFDYNKINTTEKYKKDGEQKYIDYLKNNDNNVKIAGLKMMDMEVDSLPLSQHFDFDVNLNGADGNYIYFNPNQFNFIGENPFKSEERFSDIDFGYRSNYSLSAVYKLPAGYKTDSLLKSITIITPDESIVFKRIIADNEGTLLIKYILDHKKTIYFRNDYPDIRVFYKKMFEMLNEPVVLKKG